MHITCIFENEDSTLCETKNYKSGEFWGNSGEFWGKSDEKLFIFFACFPRCEIHFTLISPVDNVKTGENFSPVKKVKVNSL